MALVLWPAEAHAATEWKFWPSAYLGVYRDGNVEVVGARDSDNVARIGVSIDLSAKKPPTTFLFTYTPYHEAYQNHGELDATSHQLSASLAHEISRRSSFHLGLGGWLAHSHVLQTVRPGQPTTLVPRTRETNLYLDLRGRVGTGRRSFFDWSAGGSTLKYDDPALQDQNTVSAAVGWGFELDQKSDVGARFGAQHLGFQTQQSTDTGSFEAFYDHQFSHSLSLSAHAGAIRSDTGTSTSTDPKYGLNVDYSFPGGSSLAAGVHQNVSAGWGAASATLDRGTYVALRPGSRTQRYQTSVTAYYWRREAQSSAASGQDIETLEAAASFEWLPGRRHFALGGFYSYHDQNDLNGTNPGLETTYSSGGVFFRWTFRVASGDKT